MGYGLAACVGLSAIGISGPVGEEIIQMSPGVAARSVAWCFGALLGTLVAGQLRDLFGSHIYALYPMAALAICGIGATSWLLKANGPQ
jgi:hypothetical protein